MKKLILTLALATLGSLTVAAVPARSELAASERTRLQSLLAQNAYGAFYDALLALDYRDALAQLPISDLTRPLAREYEMRLNADGVAYKLLQGSTPLMAFVVLAHDQNHNQDQNDKHLDLLAAYLERLAAPAYVNRQNSEGRSALHIATELCASKKEEGQGLTERDQALLHLLLTHGAKVNQQDRTGLTPLALSTAEGPRGRALVALFLGAGAAIDQSNYAGQTPLMRCLMERAGQAAEELIERGADISLIDHQGEHALGKLLEYEFIDDELPVLQKLVANGADVHWRSSQQDTTLMLLLKDKIPALEAVKFMLAQGVDLNAQNEAGQTALMLALKIADIELAKAAVRLLLAHSPDLGLRDHEGVSALAMMAKPEFFDLLSEHMERLGRRDWIPFLMEEAKSGKVDLAGKFAMMATLHERRSKFVPSLKLVAARALARQGKKQTIPTPKACVICEGKLAVGADEHRALPLCSTCLSGDKSNEELEEAILQANIAGLRKQLKGLAQWKFCETEGCFNGRLEERAGEGSEEEPFACGLCGRHTEQAENYGSIAAAPSLESKDSPRLLLVEDGSYWTVHPLIRSAEHNTLLVSGLGDRKSFHIAASAVRGELKPGDAVLRSNRAGTVQRIVGLKVWVQDLDSKESIEVSAGDIRVEPH